MDNDIQDIRERLIKIETLLESNNRDTDLKLRAIEEKIAVANHRITDLEDSNKWLWRTALVGFASAIVSILLKFL